MGDGILHEFQRAIIENKSIRAQPLEVMRCLKCGWWTSDMDVENTRLVVFYRESDGHPGRVQVAYTCEEMMINSIQNG